MNKLMTINMHMTNQLRIDQLLKINQLAKSYDGNLYFLTKNRHVINAAKFPSLITYLLTVKSGQALTLIIDGPSPHFILRNIEDICSSTAINQKEKILQPVLKVKL
jgi:phosphotransferase system HPr-like phosphotransfer protein